MKALLTFILSLAYSIASGQAIEKTFQGWWASTNWIFEFKSDGTYKRTSSGHYGHTKVIGEYAINKDTIRLLTGFNETHGTVNEKYLIDNDTLLVDLYLRYDYLQTDKIGQTYYGSKKREVKYPQTRSVFGDKLDLENVLNLAFNSDAIRKYYHFSDFPGRKLVIEKYYYLDAKIKVDTLNAIYKLKDEIREKFYIEFEDINHNKNSIQIAVKLHDEGVRIWFYYMKIDGKWIPNKPYIIED